MAGSIQWDDSKFVESLERAVKGLKLTSKAEMITLGIKIQNNARSRAPVDTGLLRNSIEAVPGEDESGPYVDIGTNVEYAPFQEYGTSKMAAQPYLRPALLEEVTAWRPDGIKPEGG